MSDSPVKKLSFEPTNKENAPVSTPVDADKPIEKPVVQEALHVAPGVKAMEADEPLLQENPHRFVLFPIRYHEVSGTSTRRA
jgi:ribonucleoside-diphosphate reductase subunit M2